MLDNGRSGFTFLNRKRTTCINIFYKIKTPKQIDDGPDCRANHPATDKLPAIKKTPPFIYLPPLFDLPASIGRLIRQPLD
jgi:hypothetical protein